MKKILIAFMAIILRGVIFAPVSVKADDIPIDEEHFPDEEFRDSFSYSQDKDNNGVLSESEINNPNFPITFSVYSSKM